MRGGGDLSYKVSRQNDDVIVADVNRSCYLGSYKFVRSDVVVDWLMVFAFKPFYKYNIYQLHFSAAFRLKLVLLSFHKKVKLEKLWTNM